MDKLMKTNKSCQICDEPVPTKEEEGRVHGKPRVYCSAMCSRIAKRRMSRKFSSSLPVVKCKCGCGREFQQKTRRNVYASNSCLNRHRGLKTDVVGKPVDCAVCGKSIIRITPNMIMCRELCEPPEGKLIECKHCGEDKHYDEFYDYRHNVDGKFPRKCKACYKKQRKGNK